MTSDAPLRKALRLTLEGLYGMIGRDIPGEPDTPTSNIQLKWMIISCLGEIDTMPVDKMSRWIGFVQGVLAAKGELDVNAERDRTRPFFHEAYAEMGISIPETKNR